jgi:palmitoyl-protein thioesterase
MLLFILFFSAIFNNIFTYSTNSNIKPIVLLHGIESTSENLNDLKKWIENNWNRPVFNLELGDGKDYSTGTPVYTQIEEFKLTLHEYSELKNGFDFIGISQGGIIGRGYVQLYNNGPDYKIDNMITLVSPHGGVYDKSLGFINFYTKKMQKTLSFSNYWRNPNEMLLYLTHSAFLADANNEKLHKNDTYKKNMDTINNFVMVYSPEDEIIKPPDSGIFATFNSKLNSIDLFEQQLYKQDWIGLKKLNQENRLHIRKTNCTHVEHRMPVCFPQLYPILNEFL